MDLKQILKRVFYFTLRQAPRCMVSYIQGSQAAADTIPDLLEGTNGQAKTSIIRCIL